MKELKLEIVFPKIWRYPTGEPLPKVERDIVYNGNNYNEVIGIGKDMLHGIEQKFKKDIDITVEDTEDYLDEGLELQWEKDDEKFNKELDKYIKGIEDEWSNVSARLCIREINNPLAVDDDLTREYKEFEYFNNKYVDVKLHLKWRLEQLDDTFCQRRIWIYDEAEINVIFTEHDLDEDIVINDGLTEDDEIKIQYKTSQIFKFPNYETRKNRSYLTSYQEEELRNLMVDSENKLIKGVIDELKDKNIKNLDCYIGVDYRGECEAVKKFFNEYEGTDSCDISEDVIKGIEEYKNKPRADRNAYTGVKKAPTSRLQNKRDDGKGKPSGR